MLEEVEATTNHAVYMNQNEVIKEKLSRPVTYKNVGIFRGEISPLKLVTTARMTIHQFETDYKLFSSYHLIEWRARRDVEEIIHQREPMPEEYRTLINNDNYFCPSILCSMEQNSENMAMHLTNLLCLTAHDQHHEDDEDVDDNTYLTDEEILDLATRHNLPITVSIDGSYNKEGVATTTVCILAPDVREYDLPLSTNWQTRPAKILLIRSWRLPKQWGVGKSSINMAEAMGFVIGAHTIPPKTPILYVTDSNTARALQ